jgi:hypothetical protein
VCRPVQLTTEHAAQVCLLDGHGGWRDQLARDLRAYASSARQAGIPEVVPTQVREGGPDSDGGYGILVPVGDDTALRLDPASLAYALVGGGSCPQLRSPEPTEDPGAYLSLEPRAAQTVRDMIAGLPPARWQLTPRRFARFVRAAARCDFAVLGALR